MNYLNLHCYFDLVLKNLKIDLFVDLYYLILKNQN